jgi:hypothetical protein
MLINNKPPTKELFAQTKINKKTLKNYKQIKYQRTKEGKLIKHKRTNKSQPEPAQVGNLNPK